MSLGRLVFGDLVALTERLKEDSEQPTSVVTSGTRQPQSAPIFTRCAAAPLPTASPCMTKAHFFSFLLAFAEFDSSPFPFSIVYISFPLIQIQFLFHIPTGGRMLASVQSSSCCSLLTCVCVFTADLSSDPAGAWLEQIFPTDSHHI